MLPSGELIAHSLNICQFRLVDFVRAYAILIFANMLEPQAKPFETTTGTGDTDMLSHTFGKQKSPFLRRDFRKKKSLSIFLNWDIRRQKSPSIFIFEISVSRNLLPHLSLEISVGRNLLPHFSIGYGLNFGHHAGTGQGWLWIHPVAGNNALCKSLKRVLHVKQFSFHGC